MRVLLLSLSLVGCGKILDVPVDASPDVAIDQPPATAIPRLYLVASKNIDFTTSKISLEVLDQRDLSLIRHVDLGFAGISSAAISADGTTVFVADRANGEIGRLDTTTGMAKGAAFPVAGVRSIVLSPDGASLFATAGGKAVKIDLATGTQTPSPTLGSMTSDIALDLDVSPDGQRLGVSTAGSSTTITLVRTTDMSVENGITILTPVPNCGAEPGPVRFGSNNLLFTWDLNCDALYQVDVGTHTQLMQASIQTGRDSAASFQSANKLARSSSANLVYSLKEDGHLAIMNPANATFTQVQLTDVPFAIGPSTDGAQLYIGQIHRFNGGGADTLTRVDTATANVMENAYTLSIADQAIVHVQAVTSL